MSEISPLSQSTAPLQTVSDRRVADTAAPTGSTRSGDSVEVSANAQLLARLAALPDVRHDLVSRVKGEIAAGTYETDAKLNTAVDSLFNDLS